MLSAVHGRARRHAPLEGGVLAMRVMVMVVVAFAAPAVAAEDACSRAFTASAQLTKSGDLMGAQAALVSCASEKCPAAMRPLCVEDLRKLEGRMPSVVIAAKDTQGVDVVEVSVSVDGQLLVARLEGKAVELNPGRHALRFEREGRLLEEQQVVIREGEKNRPIEVVVRAAPVVTPPLVAPPAREVTLVSGRPTPAMAWVTGGLAVLAGGLWAGFGISGFVQKGALESCKGTCSHPLVQSARTVFLVADVSAIVTLVSATVTFLIEFVGHEPIEGSSAPASR